MTVLRERHAFEGQTLAVISSIRRRGVLLLLVSLPDGSRSLIPAKWTSWDEGHNGSCLSRDNLDENGGGNQSLKRRPVAKS